MYLIEYLEYKNFVNSERSLSDCIRSEIHSKVVFVVTSGSTFSQPGYILSDNKLASLPGNEGSNIPWV